jgi:hypothetical protein
MPAQLDPVSLSPTVGDVFKAIIRRPGVVLWTGWNWKAALMSSIMRGSIFFSVNLFASPAAALSALGTELLFRPFLAGSYGAVSESFRAAQPAWAATLIVAVVGPGLNHLVELSVHWARGTQRLGAGVLASVSFSVISGLFNLFAMRRGVFIVGEGRRPLAEDFRRIPAVLGAFLLAAPQSVWRQIAGVRGERACQLSGRRP